MADPARLQQVFWNLLKNAVKFTSTGGRIVVRSSNHTATPAAPARNMAATHVIFTKVPETATKSLAAANGATTPAPASAGPQGFLRIEVCDEGIGIEPQHLRRIFNAFDQGQASITQRFGGLGLGLAISKAMVEAHGGTLSVSSEGAGQGSDSLPSILHTCPTPVEAKADGDPDATLVLAANTVPTPANGAKNGGAPRGRRSRAGACCSWTTTWTPAWAMQRLLNRRGYQVVVAHSVAEGLAKAGDGERFDLLISDLGLPDGSGCDLMTSLRARGGPPGIAYERLRHGKRTSTRRARPVSANTSSSPWPSTGWRKRCGGCCLDCPAAPARQSGLPAAPRRGLIPWP